MATSSIFRLLRNNIAMPVASMATSYPHIERSTSPLKFDGELFRLYVISALASPPRRIIRSTHFLRTNPIYHLTERKAISERTKGGSSSR